MTSIFQGLYRLYDTVQALRGTNNTVLTTQEIPNTDLRGKWVIITGSNNGVGFEAAVTMASWGANLILACREPPAWEQHPTIAVERCKEAAEGQGYSMSTIEWWELDMADFSSVETFCQRWLGSGHVVDILCNNAGTAYTATTKAKGAPMTKDGFQLIHQVRFPPRRDLCLFN